MSRSSAGRRPDTTGWLVAPVEPTLSTLSGDTIESPDSMSGHNFAILNQVGSRTRRGCVTASGDVVGWERRGVGAVGVPVTTYAVFSQADRAHSPHLGSWRLCKGRLEK